METRPCKMCGKAIELKIARDLTRKWFCGRVCSTTWHGLRRDMRPIRANAYTPEALAKRSMPGSANPRWRPVGSRRTTRHGYVEVKVAEPNVWEYEHRVVAAAPAELVVHHRDEDKTNNAPENLELMTAVDHLAHHSRKRKRHASA